MERQRWVSDTYMVFFRLFYDGNILPDHRKVARLPPKRSDWDRLKEEKPIFFQHFKS